MYNIDHHATFEISNDRLHSYPDTNNASGFLYPAGYAGMLATPFPVTPDLAGGATLPDVEPFPGSRPAHHSPFPVNTAQHLLHTLPSISPDTPLWRDIQQATPNPTDPFGDLSVALQALLGEGEGYFATPQANIDTTLSTFEEIFGEVNVPADYLSNMFGSPFAYTQHHGAIPTYAAPSLGVSQLNDSILSPTYYVGGSHIGGGQESFGGIYDNQKATFTFNGTPTYGYEVAGNVHAAHYPAPALGLGGASYTSYPIYPSYPETGFWTKTGSSEPNLQVLPTPHASMVNMPEAMYQYPPEPSCAHQFNELKVLLDERQAEAQKQNNTDELLRLKEITENPEDIIVRSRDGSVYFEVKPDKHPVLYATLPAISIGVPNKYRKVTYPLGFRRVVRKTATARPFDPRRRGHATMLMSFAKVTPCRIAELCLHGNLDNATAQEGL